MKVWRRNYSLRQRVLAGLFVATFGYWSVVAVLSVQYNMKEVHELYDIHLAHTALALLRLNGPDEGMTPVLTVEGSIDAIEQLFQKWPDLPERVTRENLALLEKGLLPAPAAKGTDDYIIRKNIEHGLTLRYQLWREDGRLLFQSANAPNNAMTKVLGFSIDADANGQIWRNYSIWDANHKVRAVVSEPNDERMQLVRSITISAINPIVLGMPFFILLLWLSVRSGLGPLTDLSRAIARRDGSSLVLLEDSASPRELKPIVLALNNLMRRMQQALETERRFNANAAHELNTPLAAIQAHLYAARFAKNDAERQRALEQAQLGTERGIRLVSQMLALARLGSHAMAADLADLDLNDIAQDVCAELTPIAMRRGQTLEILAAPGSMRITGQADLLHQLISNLVDNAMRYSPPDGHIMLDLSHTATGLRLSVCDNGPGIPAAQREQVFNRFFRMADQSVSGTGLGLAICRKIATLHQAHISLSEGPAGRGLSVQVDFPAVH